MFALFVTEFRMARWAKRRPLEFTLFITELLRGRQAIRRSTMFTLCHRTTQGALSYRRPKEFTLFVTERLMGTLSSEAFLRVYAVCHRTS